MRILWSIENSKSFHSTIICPIFFCTHCTSHQNLFSTFSVSQSVYGLWRLFSLRAFAEMIIEQLDSLNTFHNMTAFVEWFINFWSKKNAIGMFDCRFVAFVFCMETKFRFNRLPIIDFKTRPLWITMLNSNLILNDHQNTSKIIYQKKIVWMCGGCSSPANRSHQRPQISTKVYLYRTKIIEKILKLKFAQLKSTSTAFYE